MCIRDRTWVIPTVVCKNKNADEWYVEEEAYAHTLVGDGIMEDKLLTQVMKDGTATIGGIKYEGIYLLKMFLEKALELPKKAAGSREIASIVIAVSCLDVKLMDSLLYCADYLKIPRDRVHLISHTESFVYYVMSPVSYTHLDVYKRQHLTWLSHARCVCESQILS